MTSRPSISRVALVAVWPLAGAIAGTQLYIQVTAAGMHHSFWQIAGWQICVWSGWAPLAPAILWLRARVPVGRPWRRGLPVHAAAALAGSSLHVLYAARVGTLFHPFSDAPMRMKTSIAELLAGSLPSALLVYGAILAAGYAFEYHERLRDRETRAAQLEGEVSRARLDALTARLQPHFLFNTLHTIAGLVRTAQPDAALGTIADLSDLLRSTLDRTAPETPLAGELAMLDRYLAIQKTRFGDRLTVAIDVDDGARHALVPVLLLQPIVENALLHGIERCPGPGRVAIRAHRRGTRLELSVVDSGPGPEKESPRDGIGLSVTRERLANLFGAEFELRLESAPGGGAEARISIPWRTAGEALEA